MDRYWLLTWRTYGTWLPGEEGFVSEYRDQEQHKVIQNVRGEPTAQENPALESYSRSVLKESVVFLDLHQAEVVAKQFRETARQRGWQLLALAVLVNHAHVVLGVKDDPDPHRLIADMKAWASRQLNAINRAKRIWWARSGSCRKRDSAAEIRQAVEYVRDQQNALVVWLDPRVVERLKQLAKEV